MPRKMTREEREAFLAARHVGVLSVARDVGRPPLTVPIWYGYQPGGNLTFFTGTQGRQAQKTALIQRAGTVSFCVQQEDLPYKYVTVEGAVIGADQPPSPEQMLAIVRRYLPEEYAQGFVAAQLANPGGTLTPFTVRPDRRLTADFSEDAA